MPNKQCSTYPIPTWIIKDSIAVFKHVITKIVNWSIKSSKVPSLFKKAIVTPLLKKTNLNPDNLKNYRPVSNLSFISKVLEKVISLQLDEYKNDNNLYETMQSAYRKKHSTETALTRIHNDILRAIDRGDCTVLVMLDLSAAFDTVDHTILLKRLHDQFGIQSSAHAWISSYLCNRTQQVMINGKTSDEVLLNVNVPQGSILGPGKYLDYTKPVGDIIRKNNVIPHFYADDSQSYKHFNSKSTESTVNAVQSTETCCSDIKTWNTSNKLQQNDGKTEAMIFGTPAQLKSCKIESINIGDCNIIPSTKVKNIGVILDPQLNMQQHINMITSCAWYHLKNLYKIRKYLTKHATEKLVHAFVTSKVDLYNNLLFGLPDISIKKVQYVLNSAAKLIEGGQKYDHVTPLLEKLHWLPYRQRMEFKILLRTYKALHGLEPQYIQELITLQTPGRTLRSNSKLLLHVPRTHKKTYGDRAFSIAAPVLWNQIPYEIKTQKTVESFKTAVKTYLFKKAFKKI